MAGEPGGMSLEEQKKLVVPFMQRAQEVEKVDPKVAYYCRLHAVDQAVSIPRRAKEVSALVSAVISKLEKDKAVLALDKDADRMHCEAFALRVFANADRNDRGGRRDLGTAKAFYAASCFLDILNQFGELDGDLVSKQRYALWRAAEMRKALREGRPALPPPAADAADPTAGWDEDQLQMLENEGAGGASGPSSSGPSTAAGVAPGGLGINAMTGIKTLSGGDSAPSPPPPPPPHAEPSDASSYGGGVGGYAPPHQPYNNHSEQRVSGEDDWERGSGGAGMYGGVAGLQHPDGVIHTRPWEQHLHPPLMPPGMPGLNTRAATGDSDPVLPGQRYKPGCPVFYCETAGVGSLATDVGTLGQVVQNEDGSFSYKVALRDAIVTASDLQVAPCPPEGAPVTLLPQTPDGLPMPATVTLVNEGNAWPPTYLVALPDGREVAAEAHQLSMLGLHDTLRAQGMDTPAQSFKIRDMGSGPPPNAPPGSPASFHLPTHPPPAGPSHLAPPAGVPGVSRPGPPPPAAPGSPGHWASSSLYTLPDNTTITAAVPNDWDPYGGRDGSGSGGGSGAPPYNNNPQYNYQHPDAALPQLPHHEDRSHRPTTSSDGGTYTSAPQVPQPPQYPSVANQQQPYRDHPAAQPPQPPQVPLQSLAAAAAGGGVAGRFVAPVVPPGHKPSVAAITEAQKAGRTAVSSLNFEDVTSAVKYLSHAIEVLLAPPGTPVRKL